MLKIHASRNALNKNKHHTPLKWDNGNSLNILIVKLLKLIWIDYWKWHSRLAWNLGSHFDKDKIIVIHLFLTFCTSWTTYFRHYDCMTLMVVCPGCGWPNYSWWFWPYVTQNILAIIFVSLQKLYIILQLKRLSNKKKTIHSNFLTEDRYPDPEACSQPSNSLTKWIMYFFTKAWQRRNQKNNKFMFESMCQCLK